MDDNIKATTADSNTQKYQQQLASGSPHPFAAELDAAEVFEQILYRQV